MTSVSLQFCARQHGLPGKLWILQSLERYIDCVATFQRTTLGKISLEPRSINFETPDVAGFAELNNRPLKPRATSSFGLPAITHVERPPGHDQIMTMTEEHVATRKHQPAVFHRGQIKLATRVRQTIPVGLYFAVNSQSRDSAVAEKL